MKLKMYFFILISAISLANRGNARCVLPVPDGTETNPSKANFQGYIKKLDQDIVTLENPSTKKIQSISINRTAPIFFTAFGGDFDPIELKLGQDTRVWFKGCKKGQQKIPEAAYIEVFSLDPNDKRSSKK